MGRVGRTTTVFLMLGMLALLGTIAGARSMMTGSRDDPDPTAPEDSADVYCTGYTDTASGLLMPHPSLLGTGKVRAILVKTGDVVKAGKPLVQLEDRSAQDRLAIENQELETARARLANAREQASNDIKIIEQQNRVDRAAATCESLQLQYAEAKKSAAENVARKADAQNAEIALRQAVKDKQAAEAVLAKLKSSDPNIALKEYEEALKTQMLKVKAAESALEEDYVIRAPCDGTIVEINYQIGGPCPLPFGDPSASRALVMRHDEPLIIRAEIDQECAMMVKIGQKTTITIHGASGSEYTLTGKVEKLSTFMQKSRPHTLEPDQFANTWERECIIAFDLPAKNEEIVQGMPVSVEIHTRPSR
jgi:multidrug resistance efflux pump